MTKNQFILALNHLMAETPPLVLPYGLTPGEAPGGAIPTFTAKIWGEYVWNPPGVPHYAGQPADPAASAKPTWAMIQAALAPAELEQAKTLAVNELRSFCQYKITTEAYGVSNIQEEIFLRLRNGHHATKDRERERLQMLCKTREAAIQSATTVAAVEGLIAAARAADFWKPPPATPPSRSR